MNKVNGVVFLLRVKLVFLIYKTLSHPARSLRSLIRLVHLLRALELRFFSSPSSL